MTYLERYISEVGESQTQPAAKRIIAYLETAYKLLADEMFETLDDIDTKVRHGEPIGNQGIKP